MKFLRTNQSSIKYAYIKTFSEIRLYRVWASMIQRCENPKDKDYKHYGGRGISICPEWRNDPMFFINWALANGYKEGLEIDRIDNDGNYQIHNCHFVTSKEQARNRRDNKFIKIGDEKKTLAEHAEQAGIRPDTLWHRIDAGWSEDKLLVPARSWKK